MVSSLWVISDSLGGAAGSGLGSAMYDLLGFTLSCLLEAVLLLGCLVAMAGYSAGRQSASRNGVRYKI